MRSTLIASGTAVAIAGSLVSSCREDRSGPTEQQTVSYASREPGSVEMPTNDASLRLLAADGPARHFNFHELIVNSGKPCDVVTSAVFKAGLDGTDEWRVKCANSGAWAVWFQSSGRIEIIHCLGASCV